MQEPIKWSDSFYISKERKVYTEEQLGVPGIRIFAKHNVSEAIASLSWHYHENAFEFVYVVNGTLTFATRESDYKITGGDVYVSFPGEVHSTRGLPISLSDIYWFQLDISDPEHFLFLEPDAARTLIASLKEIPHHVIQTDNKYLSPIIQEAFTVSVTQQDPYLSAAYLNLILQYILEVSRKEQFLLTPDIGKSMNYILDHITEPLPSGELARQVNMSVTHYTRKFRQQAGMPPRQFINQQKIEYAKDLLLDGASITDIAMELGFSSSSYFTSVFKKYTRKTPSEYLKLQKRKQRKERL